MEHSFGVVKIYIIALALDEVGSSSKGGRRVLNEVNGGVGGLVAGGRCARFR